MKFMLSFDRGLPICHCLDKKGHIIETLHITEEQSEPDITVDNINELIDEDDIEKIKKSMKLSSMEVKVLKRVLKSNREEGIEKLNDRLKLALQSIKDIAKEKLKKKINFSKSDDIDRIVPVIGSDEVPFDRSIFLTGPSGSGKSFLAKEIMKHDLKSRPCVIFSKISEDESLKDLKKLKINKSKFPEQRDGESRFIKIRLECENDLLDLPSNEELKDCVCLFDDIDSFPHEIAEFLGQYRDSLLECGRHTNTTLLNTSHQLYNWAKTRIILNEANLVCLFPHSNKRNSMQFLKDRLGLDKFVINKLVNEAMEGGRFLICRMAAPNIVMHNKGLTIV